MTRHLTVGCLAATLLAGVAMPAGAQRVAPPVRTAETQVAASWPTDLAGLVVDDRGQPIAGAVVSALGATTVFAVSDREGRFVFRSVAPGPYLVRVHLQGYLSGRGRVIQVNANVRNSTTLTLFRREARDEPPVLAAGLGPAAPAADPADAEAPHDHGEMAWRLRHLKRSVLKDAGTGLAGLTVDDDSFIEESIAGLGRAVGSSARLATALFADIPFNGEINLLTSTAFHRPQDLFAGDGFNPRGVAYISLAAPGSGGEWSMRGATTQGDLASWIVEGAYLRDANTAHRVEAGLSYGMQRYLGGNADALAAMTDGSRNVGSLYAYDTWTTSPQLVVSYGAKYARYDYLGDRALVSPRASVRVTPLPSDTLAVSLTVARREIAPGADEFLPPASGIWLPPERTFSPLSNGGGFTPQRIDHVEVAAERLWQGGLLVGVRAFRQAVDDQLVTVFGDARPGSGRSVPGHYYVASGGDVDARGWGLSLARELAPGTRGTLDYAHTEAVWLRSSPDAAALARIPDALRSGPERFDDLTASLESAVEATATRVLVVYRVSTAFAAAAGPVPGRFTLQINQALPFMGFSNARWEMLLAVRNLFRDIRHDASVYDELLVVRPPKRVVGGLTLKF